MDAVGRRWGQQEVGDQHGGSGGNMALLADDMATKFCFVSWQVLEESIAQVDISFVGGLFSDGEEHSVLVYERQPEHIFLPPFLDCCLPTSNPG